MIKAVATQCKDKADAKGVMHYALVVENGKFKSFKTTGLEMKAFNNCMRSNIKGRNLTKMKSARGSLKF